MSTIEELENEIKLLKRAVMVERDTRIRALELVNDNTRECAQHLGLHDAVPHRYVVEGIKSLQMISKDLRRRVDSGRTNPVTVEEQAVWAAAYARALRDCVLEDGLAEAVRVADRAVDVLRKIRGDQ